MTTWIVTADDFAEMHRIQGGRCGICRERIALVPDHSHTSMRVRGLLCRTCNLIEGAVAAKMAATGQDIPMLVARWMAEGGYPDLDAEMGRAIYVKDRSKFDGSITDYVEAL